MSDPAPAPPPRLSNDPYEVNGVQAGFQLPGWIWRSMFACYAIFFLGIGAATGRDTATLFMLVISALYALMYFATAGILHAQKGPERASPLERIGGVLDTWTGPMDAGTVAAQILAVPAGFAFLGVTFLVVRATSGF
ncbi:MAG: hypothetical protein ACREB7_16845 [Sphingopyxis sp.]|uniref:hypothetical protein n=1 Tax=Sphingopyxis sp. TaxID=1908224 RepID=UPI003D6D06AF